MNEDKHKIDDLFRGGIEGHEEAVPPSVWEAVSSDLDKKQFSYYKKKYSRLKRASLLLLLLCFLGGSYLVYKAIKEIPDTGVATETKATHSQPQNNLQPAEEPLEDVASAPAKNKTQNRAGAEGKMIYSIEDKANENTSGTGNYSFKEQKEIKAGAKPVLVKEQLPGAKTFVLTVPINHTKRLPTTTPSRIKKGKAGSEASTVSNELVQLPAIVTPLPTTFIPSEREGIAAINLFITGANQKFILPPYVPAPPKSKASARRRFSLTAFAAPNFSFNRLEDDNRLAGPGRDRHEAHRQERDNITFTTGVLVNYELTNRLSIQSGVNLTKSTTAIGAKTVYAKADNNGHTRYELPYSCGYVYLSPKGGVPAVGDSAKTSGTTSSITYVSIPASVSFRMSNGRFSFYPSVGVGLNILTGNKASTNLLNTAINESASNNISGLKSTYMDGRIGLGIEYSLNKKFSLSLRPVARLALTPINQETPVKAYQNFVSVETGLRIKL